MKYYKKNTFTITGNSIFKTGTSATFSVSGLPAGVAFTWNKSPNLNLTGSGTSVTVTATSNGAGWVSIIRTNSGFEVARRTVWVGPPTSIPTTYINAINNGNGRDGWGTVSVSPTAHSSYTYVWSAIYQGDCDRWYLWPDGASAQLSVYLNPSDGGGQFSLTCKVYDGSTLVATVNGAAYVTPVSK